MYTKNDYIFVTNFFENQPLQLGVKRDNPTRNFKSFFPFSLFNSPYCKVKFTSFIFINVSRNSVHFYHKGSAIDKYMDTYLIVGYTLTDLQIQFRYIVFVWILNYLQDVECPV